MTRHGFLERMSDRVTPARLIDYASRENYSHLWVLNGVIPGQTGEIKNDHHDLLTYANKQEVLTSIVGRQQGKKNVRVMFCESSPWPALPRSAAALSEMIGHIEEPLQVAMFGSPTSTGLRYLEKIDDRYYRRYFADPGMDKEQALPLFKQAAKPLVWSRLPLASEWKDARYLVAVDKNAAYPRASREPVGIGEAEEYRGPFDKKLPGHWFVSVSGLEKVDSRLPGLLWKGWEQTGLVTPVVKLLTDFGCEVEVHGAMVWRKHAPVFDRWARNLWEHRQNWPEGSPENEAFKAIMNNTLGFAINGHDVLDEKFRPDWHAQFVGQARALMVYNAKSIAEKSGLYPLGCYIDALYYLSPEPFIPGLEIAPGSLGGYKSKWSIPLTDEIRTLVSSPKEHKQFNMLLSKLNDVAERQAA
jgi:hypothetical protein